MWIFSFIFFFKIYLFIIIFLDLSYFLVLVCCRLIDGIKIMLSRESNTITAIRCAAGAFVCVLPFKNVCGIPFSNRTFCSKKWSLLVFETIFCIIVSEWCTRFVAVPVVKTWKPNRSRTLWDPLLIKNVLLPLVLNNGTVHSTGGMCLPHATSHSACHSAGSRFCLNREPERGHSIITARGHSGM